MRFLLFGCVLFLAVACNSKLGDSFGDGFGNDPTPSVTPTPDPDGDGGGDGGGSPKGYQGTIYLSYIDDYTYTPTYRQYGVNAQFYSVDQSPDFKPLLIPSETCTFIASWTPDMHYPSWEVGDKLTVSGALNFEMEGTLSQGQYFYSAPATELPDGSYDMSWPGSKGFPSGGLGPQTISGIRVPEAIQLLEPEFVEDEWLLLPTTAMTWRWEPGSADNVIISFDDWGNQLVCNAKDDGEFTIPANIMSQLAQAEMFDIYMWRINAMETHLSNGNYVTSYGITGLYQDGETD